MSLEGILDLAGKHLIGTVFRIPLTQLVAVTLSERPQAASLRNDGSGYTQLEYSSLQRLQRYSPHPRFPSLGEEAIHRLANRDQVDQTDCYP